MPTPISDALDRALEQAVREIPPGKRGRVTGTLATSGAEIALGWKVHPLWELGVYGAVARGGGKEAGIRVQGTW